MYKKLRNKIIELVPSLLELKKGCHIDSLYGVSEIIHKTDHNIMCWNISERSTFKLDCELIKELKLKNKFKIIGSEIRVSDIILALETLQFWISFPIKNVITINKYYDVEYNVPWILGKTLSNQSKETIEELCEIFGIN